MQYCTLTPLTIVKAGEVIPDNTVVYSNGMRRVDGRDNQEMRDKLQVRTIDALRKLIPSYPAKFQS
jgi:dynactin-6